ncbi:MAG: hypothetical protein LLF76_04000 [Planctomycetaceae bacterium]|nr:hypothetical protein [Planctomycetaceae bacterium]
MFKTDYRRQWRQLLVLTGIHFVLDMYPGAMHTVLPALQASFRVDVAAGAVLLTIFLIASNLIQVLVGHLRPYEAKPLLLYVGIALTCSILLFGLVKAQAGAIVWLSLIALLAGVGVGISHPEGLRAVHAQHGISAAASSSVFMAGGVFGFAFGGMVSTHLWQRLGVWGMAPLCGLSAVMLVIALLARIRLAVEPGGTGVLSCVASAKKGSPVKCGDTGVSPVKFRPDTGVLPVKCGDTGVLPVKCGLGANAAEEHGRDAHATKEVPFWAVLAMALMLTGSVQIVMWIVPQHISQMGASLTQGGRAVSLFSLAGGVGGMWWARSAARRGELRTIITMLSIGIVFVLLYLGLMRFGALATAALTAAGFFCFGAYPMMVGLARTSPGPNLGRRMGLIVGGTWLVASLLPMLLGKPAELWGTTWILYCIPAGFAGALFLAIIIARRNHSTK